MHQSLASMTHKKCWPEFRRGLLASFLTSTVEEKLKKCQKVYELKCSESEVRVNDYNPLILLLWKVNIDIQFVAESSLALSHYVTGYVTKAETAPYKKCGRKLGTTVLSTAAYGNLAFEL